MAFGVAGAFEKVGVSAVVQGFGPYMANIGKMQAKTKGFGSKIGKFLKMGALIGGAALVGLGAAALKLGGEFDKAYDKIRVGTGATGDALEGLKGDFKAVFAAIPTDMALASDAITQFNTLTGATGETLQTLSKQALEAARMMGEDSAALIDQFGGAMNAWQIPAKSAPAVLDAIFDVSQRTNVPMTKLVGTLASYGPVLKNLGLSVTDSIAIFGSFEKAGIEVSRVMPGINAFMRRLADEGVEDLRGGFEDMIEQIKNAETDTEALNLATQAFGAEGAQRLSVATRAGVLDIQDLRDGMRDSYGAIMETSEATMSWTEKLKILKNKALVKLEPVLIGLFDGLTKLFALIEKKVIPALEEWWKKQGPAIMRTLKEVGRYLRDFFAPALDTLADAWMNLGRPIADLVLPILKKVGAFLLKHKPLLIAIGIVVLALVAPWLAVVAAIAIVLAKWDEISAFFIGVGKAIQKFVKGAIKWVSDFPVIGEIIKDTVRTAKILVETQLKIIQALFQAAVDTIINIFKFWKAIFSGEWGEAWNALKDQAKVIWDLLSGLFGIALDAIKAIFSSKLTMIKGVGSDLGNLIVDAAVGVWEGIADLFSEKTLEAIEERIEEMADAFKELGETFAQYIVDGVEATWEQLTGLFTEASLNSLQAQAEADANMYKEIGRTFAGYIVEGAKFAWSELPRTMYEAIIALSRWVWDNYDQIGQIGLDVGKFIFDGIAKLSTKLAELEGNFYRAAKSLGWKLVKGLWTGIEQLEEWLIGKVKGFAKGIFDAIKEGLGALWPFSPSEAGIDIGKGLVVGIEKGIEQALSSLRGTTIGVRTNMMGGGVEFTAASHGTGVPQAQVVREAVLAPSVAPQAAAAAGGGVDPASLAAAMASALQGMTVQMDGRVVGSLVSERIGSQTSMLGRGG